MLYALICVLQAELAEEERLLRVQNRTTGQKCRLYTLRAVITLLVTGLLGGAVYAIIITVDVSTNPVSIFIQPFVVRDTAAC